MENVLMDLLEEVKKRKEIVRNRSTSEDEGCEFPDSEQIYDDGRLQGRFDELCEMERLIQSSLERMDYMTRTIDAQLGGIEGVVEQSDLICRRSVRIKPTAHHYEGVGELPYIKYSCPVCDAIGNIHQVHPVQQNCSLCGVRFYWGECVSIEHKRE